MLSIPKGRRLEKLTCGLIFHIFLVRPYIFIYHNILLIEKHSIIIIIIPNDPLGSLVSLLGKSYSRCYKKKEDAWDMLFKPQHFLKKNPAETREDTVQGGKDHHRCFDWMFFTLIASLQKRKNEVGNGKDMDGEPKCEKDFTPFSFVALENAYIFSS